MVQDGVASIESDMRPADFDENIVKTQKNFLTFTRHI